jgi:hypothetical protein
VARLEIVVKQEPADEKEDGHRHISDGEKEVAAKLSSGDGCDAVHKISYALARAMA